MVVYTTTFLLFPSILIMTKKTKLKPSSGLGSFVKLTTILGNFTEQKPRTILTIAFILLIFGIKGSIDSKSKIVLSHILIKRPTSTKGYP